MMSQGVRVDVTIVEELKNDGCFSPENIGQTRCLEVSREEIERRVWTSGGLLGTCFIWCKGFPLWHLVTGVTVIMVEVIWGE